jgi:hypothetical protein
VAEYKLIQDVEAEDKILGPLTLRQFIFALVATFMFYLCFIAVTKHMLVLLALFLPPALFCAFFAFPFGRDQPTETWALAKLRFWFKPRRRVWNQSGVKELVTITVPKKVERVLTNGLSQTEVKSRLRALTDTIDSRGWAIKHASSSGYTQPVVVSGGSDRLIDITSLPQDVTTDEVSAVDDIMDETNNPIARQFEAMIDQSSQNHRRQLLDQLNNVRQDEAVKAGAGAGTASNWFMSSPQSSGLGGGMAAPTPSNVPSPMPVNPLEEPVVSSASAIPAAGDVPDEDALSASLAAQADSGQESFGNLRTMQPLTSTGMAPVAAPAVPAEPVAAAAPPDDAVTATSDPDILSLAKNDDLNVATLAREAHKKKGDGDQPRNEVVISLH